MPEISIDPESPQHYDAIFRVNVAAFPTTAEADLVGQLRDAVDSASFFESRLATADGEVVGHALWTGVRVQDGDGYCHGRFAALGPVAVVPEFQRQGVGSALINAGQDACFRDGIDAVFVLGHPSYYPRFGFLKAADYALRFPADVPADAFMVATRQRDSLDGVRGVVRYHSLFDGV